MSTPVNVNAYERLLIETEYDRDETQFLVNSFRFGFPIGYEGRRTNIRRRAPNLKIRVGSETILWNKVMKEVQARRYAGPYAEPSFKNFVQSPIGLVPKYNNKDVRLIFHLSYPRNGASINSETPDDLCSVDYCDFNEAIQMCLKEGRCCFIAKSDMKSAFRNLNMKKEDWPFLLLMARSPIDKKWYFFVDKNLPFGSSISCSHFNRFSDSIAHIVMVKETKNRRPVNYLDDFFFTALKQLFCDAQVQLFLDICNKIRFPVSLEKTFWSTTTLTFLGLLINTVTQTVSIPTEKVTRAQNLIQEILGKKKVTVKQLQRLCGFLNFLCKCIVPGRTFTRRLYSYFNSSMKPFHHVRVNTDMKKDLAVWCEFLQNPDIFCRPFIDYTHTLTADDIDLYTDASGSIGMGGICGDSYFLQRWDQGFLNLNPVYREKGTRTKQGGGVIIALPPSLRP